MICDHGGVLSPVLRLLAALTLACAGLVLTGLPAQACTCEPGASLESQARRADVVFSGVLRSQERSNRHDVYTIDVERIYRGRVADTLVEISSVTRGTCGLGALKLDRSYVVFGSGSSPGLESEKCMGTSRATPSYVDQVEQVLGQGNPIPQPPGPAPSGVDPEYTRLDDSAPPEFTRLAAPGGAMVLLGLLGLVVFRQRG